MSEISGAARPATTHEWRGLPEPSRRVALRLLRYGDASRAELAAAMGLSAASMTRAVAPLVEIGLVEQGRPRTGESFGRPSIPLHMNAGSALLFGVSITHAEVVVIATDLRATIVAHRVRRLDDLTVAPVVEVVASLVSDLRAELAPARVLAVGVCLGGNVADGRTVLRAPFLGWAGVNLADQLEAATALPVRLENDLAALAEAELWFGIGREVERFIVVTVGIGTGYALVADQRVVTDADFGYGTITAALTPHWPDFAHPETLGGEALVEAARRVGRLVGTAAAFTLPEHVLVGGEAAHVLVGHEAAIAAGVAEVRHELARPLSLTVHDAGFGFWARGAATQAIKWVAGLD